MWLTLIAGDILQLPLSAGNRTATRLSHSTVARPAIVSGLGVADCPA